MGIIEDGFDDFLNDCFCKSQNARMESLAHLYNIALDDCAERAMDDGESGDPENNELGDETEVKSKEHKKAKAKSQGDSKSNTVTKGDGEPEARPTSWRKSEYELEKEKRIAENKALLASLHDPEFEKAMQELKKDAPAKRKKPSPEERRTSARFHDGAKMWVSVQLAATLI